MADQKGSLSKSSPNSMNWFKNVAKSLGYTSSELVTSLAPSMGEFVNVNASYSKELITDLREMKSNGSKFGKLFSANQQMGIANEAIKNAIEDIKSGKIYNKERQDALYEDDFEIDGFGMDDFSDGDSGKESTKVSHDDKKQMPTINVKTVVPPITQNNPMVKAVQKQTEMTMKAAQANADIQTSIATNQAMMARRIGTSTLHGLDNINNNLALLVNFQSESMTKYVGASLKYYEESLQALQSTLDEIKLSRTGPAKEERKRSADPMEDVFLTNGGLNMKGYIEQVKKNVNRQFSENMFLQPLKMMFDDTDTLKSLAASPLSFISTKIITTMIPTFLQSSMENLDKSFSAFFPALMMKINRMANNSSNPFIQILGEIFGAATRTKSSVDLSKYNRGQVPFDGETKKSIVEVIPGYLRKILAAVSGKEEIGFDYNTGTFKTVGKMKEDFDRDKNMKALSPFTDAMDDIKKRSEAFLFDSMQERKKFNDGVEKFFLELSKQGQLVNPNIRTDKNGNRRDELSEVYNFDNDRGMTNLLRQLILTMPKNQQMKMFGKDVITSRKNTKQFMEEAEDNPLINNANTIFNGLGNDEHINKKNGKVEVKKGFGLFNPTDKFGLSSLDYLRSIKTILLQGIRTFPEGGGASGGKQGSNNGGPGTNSTLSKYDSERDAMVEQARRIRKKENEKKNQQYRTLDLSPEQQMDLGGKGQTLINSPVDLSRMSDEDMRNQIESRNEYIRNNEEKSGQKSSMMQWMGKFFKGNSQDKFNLLREQVDNLVQKPAQLLRSVFDKIDSTMYSMVFGSQGSSDEGKGSFFERTIETIGEKFENMGIWMKTKLFDPMMEGLVGPNGIITKMKESDMFQNLKEKGKKFADALFGKPGEDGSRRDGLLSETGNNILDMWDGAKYYFTGKAYVNRAGEKFDDNDESVLKQAHNVFKDFGGHLKKYLMGDKANEDKDNQRGVLTPIVGGLKDGFHNFREALFGPKGMTKKDSKQTFEEMMASIKKKAPKALAWGTVGGGIGVATALGGGLGLLPSLILPGGPIGAAIVGTTLGFLSQSDKFKNWMFGEKNAVGDRIGGFISKGTQDWAKKNKSYLIGGATLGALKPILGFGILPSFLLPGGPIAGAMFGAATAMVVRSEGFQKLMFGEKDEDGKRMGGLLRSSFGKFKGKFVNKEQNNLLGNMGAGALGGAGIAAVVGKMGLMGAMLTPAGPVGGAILGAAAGIALSTDRWKKALFGEWDDKTGLRKGGLIGKFTNWFTLEVQGPLQNQVKQLSLNFQKWFTEKISNPFADAIAPIKQAFSNMTNTLTDYFKKGWDSFKDKIGNVFEENVGKPFGKFMNENVMKPLKGFLTKIITGTAKIFAPIAEAPVKILSAFSSGLREKQEQKGLNEYRKDSWQSMADNTGRRVRGERMGLFSTKDAEGNKIGKGVFGRINDMYFNKESMDAAKYSERGAQYAPEEDARITERNKKQQDKFAAKQAAIDESTKRLDVRRKVGYKHDYDNFTEDGKDISRVYNITKSRSAYKHFMNQDGQAKTYARSINKHLGMDLADILQVKDRDGFDASQMSKAQRKIVAKAIKTGLKGNALKKHLGIKDPVTEEVATETPASGDGNVEGAVKESSSVIKSSIEAMTEKMSDVFKTSSPKDEIKETLVPEVKTTNSKLTEIASKFGEILGTGSKKFKIRMSGVNPDQTVETEAKSKDVPKPKISKKLPVIKQNAPSENTEEDDRVETLGHEHDSYADRMEKRHSTSKLSKGDLLRRIATDVRIIASEVRGQLDGVGSNVYKMRRLVQKQLGVSDDDLTGKANRDRVGFMGKLRRMMFKPLDAIKDKIADVVGRLVEGVRTVTKTIYNVGKAIVMIPFDIAKGLAKGMFAIVKGIGKTMQLAATEFVKLPGKLIGVVGSAVDAVGHIIKAFGPAAAKLLEGAAGLIGGAAKGLGNVFHGVGKGIGSFAYNFGKSLGEITGVLGKTVVKLAGSLGSMITGITKTMVSLGSSLLATAGKMISGTTQMLVDFSLKTVSAVGNTIVETSKTLLSILTSPLKFIGQTLGKVFGTGEQKVRVVGGDLDSVKVIETVKVVKNVNGYSGDGSESPSMMGRIKGLFNRKKENSHASGLDNVPHDDYKANLHQGEMVVPAKQANAIRRASGAPTVQESKVTGPVNNSNSLVNNMGKSNEVTISDIGSKAKTSLTSIIKKAIADALGQEHGPSFSFGDFGGGEHEEGHDEEHGEEGGHGFGGANHGSKGGGRPSARGFRRGGRALGRMGRRMGNSRLGRSMRARAGRGIASRFGIKGIRGAAGKGLSGGLKGALLGPLSRFMNNRKNNFALQDKLTKMNIIPGVTGNVVPFPQPGKSSGILGHIVSSVFGSSSLPNVFGGGANGEHSVDVGKAEKGAGGSGRRDVNHEMEAQYQKNERAAVAGFRVANVGLLSMIETNTRRAADDLDWIVDWLKKFKPCCDKPGLPGAGGPGGPGGGGGGNGGPGGGPSGPGVPQVPAVPTAPSVPEIPGMPNVPGVPTIPGMPNIPGFPLFPWLPGRVPNKDTYPFPLPGDKPGKGGKDGKGGGLFPFFPIPIPLPGRKKDGKPGKKGKDKKGKDKKDKKGKDKKNKPNKPSKPIEFPDRRPKPEVEDPGKKRPKEKVPTGPSVDPVKPQPEKPIKPNTTPDPNKDKPVRKPGPNEIPFDPSRRKKKEKAPVEIPDKKPEQIPDRKPKDPIPFQPRQPKHVPDVNPGRTHETPAASKKYDPSIDPKTGKRKGLGQFIRDEQRKSAVSAGSWSDVNWKGIGQNAKGAVSNAGSKIGGMFKGGSKGGGGLAGQVANYGGAIDSAGSIADSLGSRGGSSRGGSSKGSKGVMGKVGGALGKAGKAAGSFLGGSKALKTAGSVAKGVGKGLGKLGLGVLTGGAATLAFGALDAADGVSRAGEFFGLKEGQEATGTQKTAAGAAGSIAGFIPGVSELDDMMGGKLKKGIAQTIEGGINAWDGVKSSIGDTIDTVTDQTSKAWGGIKSGVGKGWEATKGFVGDATDTVASKTSEIWNGTKEVASKGWESAKGFFGDAVDGIGETTSTVWNGAKEIASTGWESAKGFFGDAVDGIGETTSNVWNGAKEIASTGWESAKGFFGDAVDGIGETTSNVWNGAKEIASTGWESAKGFFGDAVDGIGETTSTVWNGAKDLASTGWEKTKGFFGDAVDGISETTSTVWNGAKEIASTGWESAKGFFGDAVDGIGETTSTVWNGAKDIASSGWESAKGFFGDAVTGIGDVTSTVWNGATEIASSGWESTKGFFSGAIDGISGITSSAWSGATELASSGWEATKGFISSSADTIASTTNTVWNGAKDLASQGWDATKGFISDAASGISSTTSSTWSSAKETASSAWDATKGFISDNASTISSVTSSVWSSAKEVAGQKWDQTKGYISDKASAIASDANSKFEAAKSAAGQKWDQAKGYITDKASAIASDANSKFEAAKSAAGQKWDQAKGYISDKASAIAQDANSKFEAAKSAASGHWDNAKSYMSEKASAIASDVSNKFESAKGSVSSNLSDMASSAGSKASDIANSISSALSSAASAVSSFLSGVGEKAKGIAKSVVGQGGPGPEEDAVELAAQKAKDKVNSVESGKGGPNKAQDAIELKAAEAKMRANAKNFVPGQGGPGPKEDAVELAAVESGKGAEDVNKEWGAGSSGMLNGSVYYSQNDARWSSKSLVGKGGPSFGEAGCGPTAAAMALSQITGKEITPTETLKFAQEGGYVDPNKGTRSDFFQGVGEDYGVSFARIDNNEGLLRQELQSNRPVILRGQGGKAYTPDGHYVVATGIDSKGKILVNDPISKGRSIAYDADKLLKNTTSSFLPTYGAGVVGQKGIHDPQPFYGAGEAGTGVFKGWTITSHYGDRDDPINGQRANHRGYDLVKYDGYPIPSFTNGEVTHVGYGASGSGYSGYGNCVAVKDEKGYTHLYGHMSATKVTVGQKIKVGTVVGNQGATGRVTGSHLHYEVRKGGYGTDVDPKKYLESYQANKDFVADSSSPLGGVVDAVKDGASAVGGALTGAAAWLWRQSKVRETFDTIAMNAITGRNDKVSWDQPGSTSSNGSSGGSSGGSKGGFNIDSFIPKNTQEAILKKTAELTVMNETGGDYTASVNGFTADRQTISPDIGIAQWRGDAARSIFLDMAKEVPNDPRANYYANQVNWNDRTPWSKKAQDDLKKYLQDNLPVTKKVQDRLLLDHVRDVNLSQVYKYGVSTNKLKDPRGIVMLGEIAQTGPAHVKTFMNSYTGSPTDFNSFLSEFRGKSYWGRKPIYNSRIAKDINALQNWNAEAGKGLGQGGPIEGMNEFGAGDPNKKCPWGQGGPGPQEDAAELMAAQEQHEKGVEAIAKAAAENIKKKNAKPQVKVAVSRAPETVGMGYTDSYMTRQQTQAMTSTHTDSAIMSQAIEYLKQIAVNTKTTSDGVYTISGQVDKVATTVNSQSTNVENNSRSSVNSNQAYNANPILGQINGQQQPSLKDQKDYGVAKTIAGGRI